MKVSLVLVRSFPARLITTGLSLILVMTAAFVNIAECDVQEETKYNAVSLCVCVCVCLSALSTHTVQLHKLVRVEFSY